MRDARHRCMRCLLDRSTRQLEDKRNELSSASGSVTLDTKRLIIDFLLTIDRLYGHDCNGVHHLVSAECGFADWSYYVQCHASCIGLPLRALTVAADRRPTRTRSLHVPQEANGTSCEDGHKADGSNNTEHSNEEIRHWARG